MTEQHAIVPIRLRQRHGERRGQRERHEYRPTDKGFDLYPVLVAVRAWGDRYLADAEGSPVEFAHVGCGAEVDVVLRCREGHEVTGRRDVAARPGWSEITAVRNGDIVTVDADISSRWGPRLPQLVGLLAEAMFRAQCIRANHPYHRAWRPD